MTGIFKNKKSIDWAREDQLRNELTNSMIVMWAVIGGVAVVLTHVRAFEIGWTVRDALQLLIFCAILIVVCIREKLSTNHKAVFLIMLNLLLGVIGISTLGLLAGGVFFFPLAAIIVALFYSVHAVAVFSVLTLVLFSFFAKGFTSGQMQLAVSPNTLMGSMRHWAVYIICIGYFYVVTCLTILKYRQAMEQLINKSDQRRDELAALNIELKDSEDRFRLLYEKAPLPYQALDDRGAILDINESFLKNLGYLREDVIGKKVADFLLPKSQENFKQIFSNLRNESELVDAEFKMIKKDGTPILIKLSGKAVYNDDSTLKQIYCIFQDITIQRQVEERLTQERENFLKTFEAAPVGLLLLDTDTKIVESNSMMATLVLREPAEVIGKRGGGGLGCIHSFEDARGCGFSNSCKECPLRKAIEIVLRSGKSIHGAEVSPTLLIDGKAQQRWLNVNIEPVTLENKKHIIVAIDDITEKKQLEEQLHRFKETLDQAHDCVFMFHPDTLHFFYTNKGATNQIGYNAEEMTQMTPFDIKPEYSEETFRQLIAPLTKTDKSSLRLETIHKHKDGTIIPVDIFLQYVSSENEKGRFVAIVRDITEQKQSEQVRENLILELQNALAEVKKLGGLLPMCASCKKIRDDKGYWKQIEEYITEHSEAEFTHSICQACAMKLYPDLVDENGNFSDP